jgi:hypothetical protein
MFTRIVVPLITALAARVAAQSFEPSEFNVTAALQNLGVDVSELPTPSLAERSLSLPCALAVSTELLFLRLCEVLNADHRCSVLR